MVTTYKSLIAGAALAISSGAQAQIVSDPVAETSIGVWNEQNSAPAVQAGIEIINTLVRGQLSNAAKQAQVDALYACAQAIVTKDGAFGADAKVSVAKPAVNTSIDGVKTRTPAMFAVDFDALRVTGLS